MLDARLRNRRGVLARQVDQAHLEQARSRVPRPTLRLSVASRPGSNEVRISGSASEIGLTSRAALRRGSSAGRPNASCTDGATNG